MTLTSYTQTCYSLQVMIQYCYKELRCGFQRVTTVMFISLQQMTMNFESQKHELEMVISEKKKKKMDTMTLRIKEKEQRKTATMVTSQSKQMLEMLAKEQERLKQELQQEIQAEVVSMAVLHI